MVDMGIKKPPESMDLTHISFLSICQMGIYILDRLQLFIDYMCLVCFQMKGYVTALFSKIVKYNEYEHRWYAQLASAIKTNHIS